MVGSAVVGSAVVGSAVVGSAVVGSVAQAMQVSEEEWAAREEFRRQAKEERNSYNEGEHKHI